MAEGIRTRMMARTGFSGAARIPAIRLVLGLFLGAAMVLQAQESTAPILDLSPSGWLAASAYVRPGSDEVLASVGLRGSFALDGYAFDTLGLRLAIEGYSNLAGAGDGAEWEFLHVSPLEIQATGNQRLLAAVELKEAWFDFYAGDFDVRIGQQVMAWGQADGNNPTDNLNPRRMGTRLVSTLDEQKAGILAANMIYNLPGNLGTIQGVFMPWSVHNDLPSMAMDFTIPGTTAVRTVIEDDGMIEPALRNLEGGVRTLLYLGGLSVSASWLDYLDRFPDFDIATTVAPGGPPPPLVTNVLTPVHNRIRQFGLDAAFFAGGFDLRTEWALSLTEDMAGEDPAAKNPYLSGVVQASRSFIDGMLTFSGAWAPRIVLGHKMPADYATEGEQQTAAMMRKYDGQAYAMENVVTARVSAKLLGETLQPEAMFLAELAARDWLATVSASCNLADGVNLKAGGGMYGSFLASADSDRELGTFSNSRVIDNDYLFVELRLSF